MSRLSFSVSGWTPGQPMFTTYAPRRRGRRSMDAAVVWMTLRGYAWLVWLGFGFGWFGEYRSVRFTLHSFSSLSGHL